MTLYKDPTPNNSLFGEFDPSCVAIAGDRTIGVSFFAKQPCALHSVKFYTAVAGTFEVRVYSPNGTWIHGSIVTFPVAGTYEVPVSLHITSTMIAETLLSPGLHFIIGIYNVTSNFYTASTRWNRTYGDISCGRALHYPAPGLLWNYFDSLGTGRPITTPGQDISYPIDPVLVALDDTYEATPSVWRYSGLNAGVSAVSGNYSVGHLVDFVGTCSLLGGRFYTAIVGAHTIKVSLWNSWSPYTPLKTVDVVCSGPGTYDGLWATPYEVTGPVMGLIRSNNASGLHLTMYHTAGTHYTYCPTTEELQKLFCGGKIVQRGFGYRGAGDTGAISAVGNYGFPIELIVAY